jgi:putative ABC transport system ATP-binding protein
MAASTRQESVAEASLSEPADGSGHVVLDGVSKIYRRGSHEVSALHDVSLDLAAGELVVLLGPSGSGKTTLLNLVGAIEAPTSGRLEVSGVDVAGLDGPELTAYRRREVGFVFQFFNLVPTLTAGENVEVVAELTGPDAGSRAADALRQVGLADRIDHFPGQLSGGEQQRVAIARALVKEAPVLLADEPTGSLDLETGREILALLRHSSGKGRRTVILVTHNSAIASIADRVITLHDGEVAEDRRVEHPLPVAEVDW